MYKLFVLFFGSLIVLDLCYAETPSRIIDGKIEFAIADVDGITCWSESEKQKQLDSFVVRGGTSPLAATVVDYTPTQYEKFLSTSTIKFQNYSEFKSAIESKESLRNAYKKLEKDFASEYTAAIDLGDTNLATKLDNDFKNVREIMKALYATLKK